MSTAPSSRTASAASKGDASSSSTTAEAADATPEQLIYRGAVLMKSFKFAEAEAALDEAWHMLTGVQSEQQSTSPGDSTAVAPLQFLPLQQQAYRRTHKRRRLNGDCTPPPRRSSRPQEVRSSRSEAEPSSPYLLYTEGPEASYFHCPMIVARQHSSSSSPQGTTVPPLSTDALLAVCFFNLGLSYQLDGSSVCQKVACSFYKDAWACLRRYADSTISTNSSHGLLLLEMAICLNLSMCLFDLGQLVDSSHWNGCLQLLLDYSGPTPVHQGQQEHTPAAFPQSLRHFFTLASVLGNGFIAAAAA